MHKLQTNSWMWGDFTDAFAQVDLQIKAANFPETMDLNAFLVGFLSIGE